MTPPLITLASGNRHKLSEFQKIWGSMGILIQGLPEDLNLPSPAEEGQTFLENARQKALYYGHHVDSLILADDSGLCVDALQGAPGIYSARYAGEGATDEENIQKLLQTLAEKSVPEKERTARFECALVLVRGNQVLFEATGFVAGQITERHRGLGGFGYDPVFYYPPLSRTFSELTPEEKNQYSHRYHAIQNLAPQLQRFLANME